MAGTVAQIPHLYRTVARGSPTRQQLFERRGLFQAPYLEVQPVVESKLTIWLSQSLFCFAAAALRAARPLQAPYLEVCIHLTATGATQSCLAAHGVATCTLMTSGRLFNWRLKAMT